MSSLLVKQLQDDEYHTREDARRHRTSTWSQLWLMGPTRQDRTPDPQCLDRRCARESGTPPGEGVAAQELLDWDVKNSKAYGVIFMTCSDEIQTDLTRLETEDAKVIWDYLRAEYLSNSVEARLQ
ncbi:hypothetical protein CF319_g2615, partial [Tilletia indica]